MKQGHNKVVELVIISGRSGAGKTVALHSLEDLGYYCVDNLPVVMLEDIVKLAKTTYPKLAVSIDVRNMPLSEEEIAVSAKANTEKLFGIKSKKQ